MRDKATFTSNSFSDPNIANPYYPGGDTGVEAGHVAVVMSGADRGDVQPIASVTGVYTYNLVGNWKITPATGDLVVICSPDMLSPVPSPSVYSKNSSASAVVVAQPPIQTLAGQTWLFRVRTENADGVYGSDVLAPMRDIYFFGSGITVPIIG